MITLRSRFDLHRDLNQWSRQQYALGLGYEQKDVEKFLKYLDGKRELTAEEANMILSNHQYHYRGGEMPDEIVAELGLIAARALKDAKDTAATR